MRQKEKIRENTEEPVTGDQCHHFWTIEIANGPVSKGICKICGETKDFLNTFPDFTALKRNKSPLDLPKIPGVEMDKDSKS
ncbi:hypothetical protein ACFLWU_00430 [Chloroflexota bacterium]